MLLGLAKIQRERTASVHIGERAEVIHRQHRVVDCERVLRRSDLPDEGRDLFERPFQHEQFHAMMAADVAVEVRCDDVLVLVTEVHHFLLDARRFVVENHCDDAHQVSIFEFLILELTEEVSTRLTKYFTATSIAVVVRELVDSIEQLLRHRDADNTHITMWAAQNIKYYHLQMRH